MESRKHMIKSFSGDVAKSTINSLTKLVDELFCPVWLVRKWRKVRRKATID